MTIFDLLFLAVLLGSVVTLVVAASCGVFGRRSLAVRILRSYFVCALVYLGIVVLVSLVMPQRVVKTGEQLCFDDWCIAVDGVDSTVSAAAVSYEVSLILSSRARGISQREKNLAIYVTDARGTRYDPVLRESDVPFDRLLRPGESVRASRIIKVPLDAPEPNLVIAHEGGFPIGWFIIGGGPFRKAPVLKLPHPKVGEIR